MYLKESAAFAPNPHVQVAVPIAVAEGDGIGPEIMRATLLVLDAAGARLEVKPVAIGEKIYRRGVSSGIDGDAWDRIKHSRAFLKGPITTPQGGGYKSLNVTLRKVLGLYANVRPCVAYHPFVATRHAGMDVVIVRENEEDLYAGIEHRQTDDVVQCLKLISRTGCERIVRYAFEYARTHERKKVSCFTKDNIMKMTDGLFHRVFDEIGAQYPEITKEHLIVDIGSARLADEPTRFDVVVTPNLYGDIISDVAAQIAGSVGMAPSANIGPHGAMFEAIHGSAPDIAGQGVANPSGLLLSAVMMLHHVGQGETAALIHNAWLRTLEDGVHTEDIYGAESREKVGTAAFANAIIDNLGERPKRLFSAPASAAPVAVAMSKPTAAQSSRSSKALVGVDVFFHFNAERANALVKRLKLLGIGFESTDAADTTWTRPPMSALKFTLQMVTNRGVKVWPQGHSETTCTDHWRCRFMWSDETRACTHGEIAELLRKLSVTGLDFIKTENLYTFDGEPGFALGQGQ